MLKIVCLNNNEKHGRDYVEILYDMVLRNLSIKTNLEFICFTDDKRRYTSGIKKRPYNACWEEQFENEKVIKLDLNMCVVGGLDALINADKNSSLDEIFKGSIHSYEDCKYTIPKSAKIIYFDGIRQHEIKSGWVPKIWKIGGGTTLELEHICNTKEKDLIENITNAMSFPFPRLQMFEPHNGHAVIVGGGPSLKDNIEGIRARKSYGQVIFSTNNTYKYLSDNDIISDAHVMVDARKENAEFVPEFSDAVLYYSSQCHPDVFNRANGKNVILWHSLDDGIQQYIGGDDTGDALVGGGQTVGMKAIALAYILGYRNFHLYGFDSSYHDDKHHSYPQKLNDNERIIEVEMNNKKYKVAPWMCTQVENFREVAKELVEGGSIITVHGEGLLPDLAKQMQFKQAAEPVDNLTEFTKIPTIEGNEYELS